MEELKKENTDLVDKLSNILDDETYAEVLQQVISIEKKIKEIGKKITTNHREQRRFKSRDSDDNESESDSDDPY